MASATACAQTAPSHYASPLGYSADVPAQWYAAGPEEVRAHRKDFERFLSGLEPGRSSVLLAKVDAGEVEAFLRPSRVLGSTFAAFVTRGPGVLPAGGADVSRFCRSLADRQSAPKLRTCGSRALGAVSVIQLEVGGGAALAASALEEGSRWYYVQLPEEAVLSIGALYRGAGKAGLAEADVFVRSIRPGGRRTE